MAALEFLVLSVPVRIGVEQQCESCVIEKHRTFLYISVSAAPLAAFLTDGHRPYIKRRFMRPCAERRALQAYIYRSRTDDRYFGSIEKGASQDTL